MGSKRCNRRWLLLALVGLCASASAHFPGLYGREFVALEAAGPARQRAQEGADSATVRTVVDPEIAAPLLQAIADLQRRDGPYAPALYEPLTQLGRLYRENGDYRRADQLYRDAVHAIRVNAGLASAQQLPILQELIALHRTSGDLEALDQVQEDHFRVAVHGGEGTAGERSLAAERYVAWQREALRRRVGGDRNARLVALYDTTQRLLDAVMAEPAPDQARQRQWTFSQLDNLYLILGDRPIHEQLGADIGSSSRVGGTTRSPEYVRQRITRLQETGVARGRDLLLDYRQHWPGMTPRAVAEVSLALADWYQWNDKLQSAGKHYREAALTLGDAGETALAEQWFSTARALPTHRVFSPRFDADGPGSITVRAQFLVSRRGNVSNIRILPVSGDDSARANALKSMLRETHFRPRLLADGTPADVQVTREYALFR